MDNRPDAAKDFDFVYGEWTIKNKMLKERLKQCEEWLEFDASYDAMPLIGGWGNVDRFEAVVNDRKIQGASIRLFDPETEKWSIYWVSANSPKIDDPMVGSFEGTHGEFFAKEPYEDKEMTVRFLWDHDGKDQARWEQALSLDDGKTWEVNWIMEFTRRA
jgi:hypothetical protein